MSRTRIGDLIRADRERRGPSQEQMARLLPCHPGAHVRPGR